MIEKSGMYCLNVTHKGSLPIGNMKELLSDCGDKCSCLNVAEIDGHSVIIIPDCLSRRISEVLNKEGVTK